jgi:hypothetical protein
MKILKKNDQTETSLTYCFYYNLAISKISMQNKKKGKMNCEQRNKDNIILVTKEKTAATESDFISETKFLVPLIPFLDVKKYK